MESVVLVIHLIIALCLIAVVLLQRSEGGALGIGGGGGGLVSQRGAGSALSRLTWWLAGAFIATSITLTILSGGGTRQDSVVDDFRTIDPSEVEIPLPGPAAPAPGEGLLDGGSLVPPSAGDGSATTPPSAN
ncbi:MAG: preprotein translocase subunit SecG [Pseudomonadota bacterium]